MTEMNTEVASTQPVEAAPVQTTESFAPQAAPSEARFTQAEMNEVAGNARQSGFKKGQAAYLEQARTPTPETQAQTAQQFAPNPAPASNGSSDERTQEIVNAALDARQKSETDAYNDYQRQADEAKLAESLQPKIADAKTRHSDFDEVVQQAGFADPRYRDLLSSVSNHENAGDMLYELAKNPVKVSTLMRTIQDVPNLKGIAIKEFSDSIKNNANAASRNAPPQPLSQVRSSNVPTDNGEKSIADFKGMDFLRG